ncbi:hypothetical protein [Magnetovibrio sp.]|uniref:hypothetical protein n=1 Tax=Magnetovibrio sp. TaxID=2024836 RepID=UPI002F929F39
MTPENRTVMTRKEFQDLLDAFGATPDAWPEGRKVVALRLLDNDPQAKAMFDAFKVMESALVSDPIPAHQPSAVDDLLQKVAGHAQAEAARNEAGYAASGRTLSWGRVRDVLAPFRRMVTRPELILGACTAAGVFLGLLDGMRETEQPVDLVLAYVVAVFPL